MSRVTLFWITGLSIQGVQSISAPACTSGVYNSLVPLVSDFPVAQTFCTNKYPVPPTTVTIEKSRHHHHHHTTSDDYADVTASIPTSSTSKQKKIWKKILASQPATVIEQLCTCIEDQQTVTVTVVAEATVTSEGGDSSITDSPDPDQSTDDGDADTSDDDSSTTDSLSTDPSTAETLATEHPTADPSATVSSTTDPITTDTSITSTTSPTASVSDVSIVTPTDVTSSSPPNTTTSSTPPDITCDASAKGTQGGGCPNNCYCDQSASNGVNDPGVCDDNNGSLGLCSAEDPTCPDGTTCISYNDTYYCAIYSDCLPSSTGKMFARDGSMPGFGYGRMDKRAMIKGFTPIVRIHDNIG